MIFYFYKIASFEEYYIVKSNLNFKKYVKQLKHDYTNYKKNKTGYHYKLMEAISIDRNVRTSAIDIIDRSLK